MEEYTSEFYKQVILLGVSTEYGLILYELKLFRVLSLKKPASKDAIVIKGENAKVPRRKTS